MSTLNDHIATPFESSYATLNDDWAVVAISGPDRQTFLQGQLTNDITLLQNDRRLLTGHCDPKGKLITPAVLWCDDETIYSMVRRSVVEAHLAALRKFAIFSKVTIEHHDEITLCAIDPQQAISQTDADDALDAVITEGEKRFVRLSEQVGFIAQPKAHESVSKNIEILSRWQIALMRSGFPVVDQPLSEQFLPQAFHLDELNAIHYKKGCYCGQEMVARAHYRGANRRALFLFSAAPTQTLPPLGAQLIQSIDGEHRATGTFVAAAAADQLWVQAILSSDFDPENEMFLPDLTPLTVEPWLSR